MRALLALAAALLLGQPAAAQHHRHAGGAAPPPPGCGAPAPRCANTAAPTFAPDGSLFVAWAQGGHVWVGRSTDGGGRFGLVARVNATPQPIDDNGENRPKLAVDAAGTVFVTYTIKAARPYTGDVLFSRSLDGGRSFEAPRSLSDEAAPASLRFDAIAVAPDGRLYAAWIDKRRASQPGYRGASLAVAWSDDGGASFSANRVAQDHSCECCRTAMAIDERGLPLLMWRNVFAPNIRDHALLAFADADTPGQAQRVGDDGWAIDACPHHGPALAVGAGGRRHAVWFTQGERRQGLFHAHAEPGGAFSAPRPLGDPAKAPSHPHVAAAGLVVAVAWKEFDGAATAIMAMTSGDGGETWTAPVRVAETGDASDHPLLVARNGTLLLSWLTRAEGYRLLPVASGGRP
jgi:hypothetical protein